MTTLDSLPKAMQNQTKEVKFNISIEGAIPYIPYFPCECDHSHVYGVDLAIKMFYIENKEPCSQKKFTIT